MRERHVNVSPIRGSTINKSSRPLIGTGVWHVTLFPGRDSLSRCHLPGYKPSLRLSVEKFLTTPIQPVVPIPSKRFFFLFDSPYSSLSTLWHISDRYLDGRNGSHGESTWPETVELGFLRVHWVIGPPFLDRKSLTTMSNTGVVGGWQKW